jgi:hypothetical protein
VGKPYDGKLSRTVWERVACIPRGAVDLVQNEYCGSKPINLSRFDTRPNRLKFHNAIKFQTLSLPCFNKYKELFYNTDGIKIIPNNLMDLLTERGLAYWIMDDGYKYSKGLYICTDSYTFEETEFLCDILRTKFGLECNPHKYRDTFRIYIFSKSAPLPPPQACGGVRDG